MTNLLSLSLALVGLAEKAPDPDDVNPGLLGFIVFVALAVAVVLLWLSLRKHLGRVNFDEDGADPEPPRGGANGGGHATKA